MVGIKIEYIGFRKENRNEISSMYNIRYNPELGVGKSSVRRISFDCLFCIEQLDLPWDKNEKVTNKNRYTMNKKCLNCNI